MLSDDCLIVPGAIINGFNLFEQKLKDGLNIGAVAFYFRDYPDKVKYMVSQANNNKIIVNHGMYLKKAVERVGYIDEENYFFYRADPDLALKIWQKGYLIIDSPNSYIEHFLHANINVRKSNWQRVKRDRDNFCKKWNSYLNDNCELSWIEKNYNDESLTAKNFPGLSMEAILNKKMFTAKNSVKDLLRYLIPKKYHSKLKQLINK